MDTKERNLVTTLNKKSVKKGESLFRQMYYMIKFSIKGLIVALCDEKSFRLHLVLGFLLPLALAVACLSLDLALSLPEWAIVAGFGTLLLSAECLNSALENAVDFTSTEYSPLAGKAKDLGSAAVILVGTLTLVFNLIIFGGRLYRLVRRELG